MENACRTSQALGGANGLPEMSVIHPNLHMEQELGRAILVTELVNYLVYLSIFPFLQGLGAGAAGFK